MSVPPLTQTNIQELNSETHSSWPVLPQETLHVPSGHQLQQDEARQDVEAHTNAAHNVLMTELAVYKQWLLHMQNSIYAFFFVCGLRITRAQFCAVQCVKYANLMIRASIRKSISSCSEQISGRVCGAERFNEKG